MEAKEENTLAASKLSRKLSTTTDLNWENVGVNVFCWEGINLKELNLDEYNIFFVLYLISKNTFIKSDINCYYFSFEKGNRSEITSFKGVLTK